MNISVIIPTYNRGHLLARAIESVMRQSYPAIQLIVVDDGSNDNTDAVLASYPELTVLKHAVNKGVSAARNLGLTTAIHNWIALLDSDDVWAHDKLAMQVAAIKANPEVLICHTDEIWIRNGKRVNAMNKHAKPDGWAFKNSLDLCCVSPSSVLIHRSVFETCGVFDESLPACEDYDLWLRMFCRYAIKLVDAPLVTKHGGHSDQLSRLHWGMDRFRVRALTKLLDGDILSNADYVLTQDMLREKCAILQAGALKRGKLKQASEYVQLAQKYSSLRQGSCQTNLGRACAK